MLCKWCTNIVRRSWTRLDVSMGTESFCVDWMPFISVSGVHRSCSCIDMSVHFTPSILDAFDRRDGVLNIFQTKGVSIHAALHLWTVLPHTLDICTYLVGQEPLQCSHFRCLTSCKYILNHLLEMSNASNEILYCAIRALNLPILLTELVESISVSTKCFGDGSISFPWRELPTMTEINEKCCQYHKKYTPRA